MNNNNTNPTLNGLDEGDRIQVVSAGGLTDNGRFIRIENNYLIWVRDNGTTPDLTVTSLLGISVSKL